MSALYGRIAPLYRNQRTDRSRLQISLNNRAAGSHSFRPEIARNNSSNSSNPAIPRVISSRSAVVSGRTAKTETARRSAGTGEISVREHPDCSTRKQPNSIIWKRRISPVRPRMVMTRMKSSSHGRFSKCARNRPK